MTDMLQLPRRFKLATATIFYGTSAYPVEPANMQRYLPQDMPRVPTHKDVEAVEKAMYRLCNHHRSCKVRHADRIETPILTIPEAISFVANGWTVGYYAPE